MSIDFFDPKYKKEEERNNVVFGLCDDGHLAYSTITNQEQWIASVNNKDLLHVMFTPIDHNIIVFVNKNERSQCDGMLTTDNSIIFVELKTVQKQWISDAIEQLKSTIELFCDNHNPNVFKKRLAYASNNRHPKFNYSNREIRQSFYNTTGFKLLIQNKIDI